MSTPQNPNTGSDAETNHNYPTEQDTPDPGQPQAPAAGESTDANQSYAGSAQYGQGSQFSQAEQYNHGAQYGQPEQYAQAPQQGQQEHYAQEAQQGQAGQYYQGGDYAQYNQGVYAGSQHPPVDAYGQTGAQHSNGRSGFFKSLFDFRFDNFIAVRWAGFIYIIAIVVAALSWLASIVGGILTGAAAGAATSMFSDGPSFSPWPLLLAIIFGWIVPALWVIFVRLTLELIVANVKTAENTKKIADSIGR